MVNYFLPLSLTPIFKSFFLIKQPLAIIKQLIKLIYYFFIINYLVCFMLIYSHASTAALDSGSNETPCEDFNNLSLEKQ